MEIDFDLLKIQNFWWDKPDFKYDPVLESLESLPLIYKFDTVDNLDLKRGKIVIIKGPRGVGKTTALKRKIKQLIEKKRVVPQNIFYYSCHNLNSSEQLNELIKVYLRKQRSIKSKQGKSYIFIDEITLLKNWEKSIHHLEQAGLLKNSSLLLTGSISGSRGRSKGKDRLKYHEIKMSSLSFRGFITLLDKKLIKKLSGDKNSFKKYENRLNYYLDIYLLTGGYVSAINSFLQNGAVKQNIYSNYLYWLIADVAKMGRDLIVFRQIIEQVVLRIGESLGYQTIVRQTKAKTHNTAGSYVKILESMFVAKIVHQCDNRGNLKKSSGKKIYFRDPFIFWLFYAYSFGSLNYWEFGRNYILQKSVHNKIIKNAVFSHLLRNEERENQEELFAYWRGAKKEQELDFVDLSCNKKTAILLRYGQKPNSQDADIFKEFGAANNYIITRNIYNMKAKTKIVPLSYFLFYYRSV